MITTIILIVLFVLGLGLIGWMIWRKLPQLRMIDPTALKDVQTKKLKKALMRQRMERVGGKQVEQIKKGVLEPVAAIAQRVVRKVAGRLTAVERRYQEKKKEVSPRVISKEELATMVEEASAHVDAEEYDRAEKKLIEVISHDAKSVSAYEELGRLYLRKKDYASAKETFTFLLKLSPNDASVTTSLGEVEEAMGNDRSAFIYYKEAVRLSPKNPKYLDFLIESALAIKDVLEANLALDMLRKANPENQKIGDFEEKIEEIRKAKTTPV